MRLLLVASNAIAWLTMSIGRLAGWLLIPLMLVIVLDVVLRRYFVIGSIRLQELEWHLHAALFMLCLGYAYFANAHVRIELIREGLSEKNRYTIELIGLLLFVIPLCLFLIYFSADIVRRSWLIGEASPHPAGLPYRWAIKAIVPIGFGILLLSAVGATMRAIIILFGSADLREQVRARTGREQRTFQDIPTPDPR